MAFKLMILLETVLRTTLSGSGQRKENGANRMPEIIQEIAFKDGIKQLNQAA